MWMVLNMSHHEPGFQDGNLAQVAVRTTLLGFYSSYSDFCYCHRSLLSQRSSFVGCIRQSTMNPIMVLIRVWFVSAVFISHDCLMHLASCMASPTVRYISA